MLGYILASPACPLTKGQQMWDWMAHVKLMLEEPVRPGAHRASAYAPRAVVMAQLRATQDVTVSPELQHQGQRWLSRSTTWLRQVCLQRQIQAEMLEENWRVRAAWAC